MRREWRGTLMDLVGLAGDHRCHYSAARRPSVSLSLIDPVRPVLSTLSRQPRESAPSSRLSYEHQRIIPSHHHTITPSRQLSPSCSVFRVHRRRLSSLVPPFVSPNTYSPCHQHRHDHQP